MVRICSDCGGYMGQKPPFWDTSVTHGICPGCMIIMQAKIINYHSKRTAEKSREGEKRDEKNN